MIHLATVALSAVVGFCVGWYIGGKVLEATEKKRRYYDT